MRETTLLRGRKTIGGWGGDREREERETERGRQREGGGGGRLLHNFHFLSSTLKVMFYLTGSSLGEGGK